MTSLLVLTPQEDEADAIRAECRSQRIECADTTVGRMHGTYVPGLDLLIGVGGNGKAQFALQSQYVIDHCPEVRGLICVGAAGGLTPKARPGDVVVATSTVEHDFRERFTTAALPRYEAEPTLVRGFMDLLDVRGPRGTTDGCRTGPRAGLAAATPFDVHFGPIASGDEDIVDEIRAGELRQATGAICVAWEGSGGARAARFNGIGFLEIRAITDGADADAALSFRMHLDRAVTNAARLLIAWRARALAAH